MMTWQPIETAPYSTNVLAWLHLPKNPLADAHVIAQRLYVQEDEPESYGVYRRTVGCWWVGSTGMYYPAGHVTHWMPLPEPPSELERLVGERVGRRGK